MADLLWPTYDGPDDLARIEAVPLADRGLPSTTYDLVVRAARLWPERVALSVLPDAERWDQPVERTFAELLADVHRFANVFHSLGVRLDTGDLAKVDGDGFVHLAGRAKDVIIRGGHNIDPSVIEDVLLAHPAVTAAQAVGRPDPHSGEVPIAFVTLAPGATTGAEELCAWVAANVPEQAAAPKSVTVLDALPVTPVGKPFKPALRAEATRAAVAEALRQLPGVAGVRGLVEGGAVVAVVQLTDDSDEVRVKETLDRFAITWRTEKS